MVRHRVAETFAPLAHPDRIRKAVIGKGPKSFADEKLGGHHARAVIIAGQVGKAVIAFFVVLDDNRDVEAVQDVQVHVGQLGDNSIGSPFLRPAHDSFVAMQFPVIQGHPVKHPRAGLAGIPDHALQQAASVAAGEIRQQQDLNHGTCP